jgi:hypothetical protein
MSDEAYVAVVSISNIRRVCTICTERAMLWHMQEDSSDNGHDMCIMIHGVHITHCLMQHHTARWDRHLITDLIRTL